MKIYKTQKEIEADIKDGVLEVNDDVKFEVSFTINASLKVAGNISAHNISANNISAYNISAYNINANDISAYNISAYNISANDISAYDISANDINFWAVCFAYMQLKCKSIKGERSNSKYFCLDNEIEITG